MLRLAKVDFEVAAVVLEAYEHDALLFWGVVVETVARCVGDDASAAGTWRPRFSADTKKIAI